MPRVHSSTPRSPRPRPHFPPGARPLAERQALVARIGDAIEAHSEDFMRLPTRKQGKARKGAEWEIGGSVICCREIAKQKLPMHVAEQADGRGVCRSVSSARSRRRISRCCSRSGRSRPRSSPATPRSSSRRPIRRRRSYGVTGGIDQAGDAAQGSSNDHAKSVMALSFVPISASTRSWCRARSSTVRRLIFAMRYATVF